MPHPVLAILSDLIAIPSTFPPGDTAAICAYAADRLEKAGYHVQILHRDRPQIANVVAEWDGAAPGPTLMFNAHADTVGIGERAMWETEPLVATVIDGRVHGLGAGNCKGSMAAQLWLAEQVARRGGPARGRIVFTFCGDEENLGPDGAYYLREVGAVKPDMLVVGTQTENQLITAERGVMWVEVTARGLSAHAGNPAAGDNAILRLMRVMTHIDAVMAERLRDRKVGDQQSTMNIGIFRGGENTNVVPNLARVEIDRRLLPEEKIAEAFAEIEALVKAHPEAEHLSCRLLTGTNGFRAPYKGPLVSALCASIEGVTGAPARFLKDTGASDGRYFADDGIEIVNFGPGAGWQGHKANEYVPLDELVAATAILEGVVERVLGVG
ncbi:M20 family metallopeptidase [Niveispirillum sp.]|uniref:M20 family metallopeptidase n=1 Tax=Niveispirillum sp. TaxID=1917217 RepID=UPI001B71C1C3|nr:ArgE/DapE family deacylase [Niveispirillum sp.]MBP7334755.1 ArgE/DapE family deacylase [Niveispirillum sp.]